MRRILDCSLALDVPELCSGVCLSGPVIAPDMFRSAFALILAHLMLLAGATLVPSRASAEPTEPSFSADNPGFTNVTEAAPALTLITEQAVSAHWSDKQTSLSMPQVLARFGLDGRLELRAVVPSLILGFSGSGPVTTSTDGVGVGGLYAFSLGRNFKASLAPLLSVPVGQTAQNEVEGDAQLNLAWSISDRLELDIAGRAGWAQVKDGNHTTARARWLSGALISVSPSTMTSVYAQAYVACVAGEPCEPSAGTGGALWVAPAVELYLTADATLIDGTVEPSLGVGTAVRWW